MANLHERVEVRCMSPLEWAVGWLKGFFLGAVIILYFALATSKSLKTDGTPLAAAAASVALLLGAFFWRSTVMLEEDGIAYRRYGFTRFIPYSKIKRVESVQRIGTTAGSDKGREAKTYSIYCGVRLTLVDGKTIIIGTTSSSKSSPPAGSWHIGMYGDFGATDAKGWQLRKDIDERVRAAANEPEPETPVEIELARGDRSVPQWLEALKGAAPVDANAYRGSEGAKETLWRVLEDGAAPREARAGAALALRAHLDEDGKTRMRVVGEACESPKLRVAIETALDEEAEEPRLLHALEQASHPRED